MAETEKDNIAAWMLTLELARARGDIERAAEAQRELERLGVTVTYHEPKQAAAHA